MTKFSNTLFSLLSMPFQKKSTVTTANLMRKSARQWEISFPSTSTIPSFASGPWWISLYNEKRLSEGCDPIALNSMSIGATV